MHTFEISTVKISLVADLSKTVSELSTEKLFLAIPISMVIIEKNNRKRATTDR